MVYRIEAATSEVEARAEALALEQTVELPRGCVRDPFVEREIVGRVESIEPDGEGAFRVAIDYPAATTASDPAQLLNVAFGNASLQEHVTLLDVQPPAPLRETLGGPRFGAAGLRTAAGRLEGPLTCTALKPLGLGPQALAARCETFARAGVDVIKDDHGLADHPFCRFEARLLACRAAIERAADATGRRAVYAPSVTGSPDRVRRQIDRAAALGAGAILVAPMLLGLPVLHQLAHDGPALPILAHPAFGGGPRVAPSALFGRLFRLYGADAVIYPHWGGRFGYSARTCAAIATALRETWKPLRPALPVPAGGMDVERAAELVRFYGGEVMLLIGGSLYEAGDALLERSRGFVASVRAAAEEGIE